MLSDKGSAVIRKYGILNTNVPPDHMFYGIPFPGMYLLGPDDKVRVKYFEPEYEKRIASSEVALNSFGVAPVDNSVEVSAGDVRALVRLSTERSVPGHEIGALAKFDVGPGWHIYGEPLPENYVATAVIFDSDLVANQAWDFPKPKPVRFEVLGETLPTYEGRFDAKGRVMLKRGLGPGDYRLKGTVKFQQCNDEICKLPQNVAFELPIKIEPLLMPERPESPKK
jgi:DsbC/DsbD-like thiol-disulfide interchange protein